MTTLPKQNTLYHRIREGWPWVLALVAAGILGEFADRAGVPAAHLLVALVLGAALALTGMAGKPLPRQLTRAGHAMVGAMMGGYLHWGALASIGPSVLPLTAVTLATVVVSTAIAYGMSRTTRVALPDTVLAMMPGGSAAIVACASAVGADSRLVAVAQYLRVGFVAMTAPLLVFAVQHTSAGDSDPPPAGPAFFPPLVTAPNQITGLLALTAICVLGGGLGRRLSLPAPMVLGSMLTAAIATTADVTSGFTPAGPLRDLIFLVIGLEVGLRFSTPSLRQVGKALPHILAGTILICLACTGLAWLLTRVTDMRFLDVYLATTPGGINAVLATAGSTGADVPIVSAVQSLRLFAICLVMPPLVRRFAARARPVPRPRQSQENPSPAKEGDHDGTNVPVTGR
ncbi:AbrB family transcriptional regulator [Amycolatopsis sp. NPDC059021]|uniref:AbrB family transcriptional regulator n=1 Tax=Amycolatopsis sp. NPDC059021 TaxID=3346704 RepID=UPI00366A5D2D